MNYNQEILKTEITQLNYELNILRNRFIIFNDIFGNVVDKWLVKNLNDTLSTMHHMLTNCNIINVGDTSSKVDLADFTLRQIYFCDLCRRDVTNRIAILEQHINTKEHKKNLHRKNNVPSRIFTSRNEHISKELSHLRLNSEVVPAVNNSIKLGSMEVENLPIYSKNNALQPSYASQPSPASQVSCILQPSSSKQLPIGSLVGLPLFKFPCPLNELPGLKDKTTISNNVKTPPPNTNSSEVDQLNSATKDLLQSNLETTINKLIAEVSTVNFSDSLAIKNSLKNTLSPHFKYVDVYPFGSRENGTGTASTDLDVYVDIDRSYHGVDLEKKAIVIERLEKVAEILKAKPEEWVNIRTVNARIPIIKVMNQVECIDCDISFSSGLGCCNTELIKYFVNLQPVFRKMIVFLKLWLKKTTLNVYINNYTLILLILFYLQQKCLLPPIEKLQNNIEPLEIGPWNGGFLQKSISDLKLNRTENAVKQIIGFFKYYSSPDLFHDQTLCLYLGRLVPNKDIELLTNVSLKRYNDFAEKYKDQPDLLFKFEFLNVQDPFDLANNTAKMVSLTTCRKFFNLANASFKILQK